MQWKFKNFFLSSRVLFSTLDLGHTRIHDSDASAAGTAEIADGVRAFSPDPFGGLCLRDAPTRCYATIRLSLVGGPTYLAAQAGASPSLRLHSCQQFVLPVVQQSSVVPDADMGVAGDLPSL